MTSTPSQPAAALRPDWCFIGIDETEHWNLEPRLMAHVERILSIYAFNRAMQTHCCEITPSYWLECITYDAHTKFDTPEAIREEIADLLQGVSRQDSDGYHHVSSIERAALAHPERFASGTRNMPDDAENTPEAPDWVHESWNANPQF